MVENSAKYDNVFGIPVLADGFEVAKILGLEASMFPPDGLKYSNVFKPSLKGLTVPYCGDADVENSKGWRYIARLEAWDLTRYVPFARVMALNSDDNTAQLLGDYPILYKTMGERTGIANIGGEWWLISPPINCGYIDTNGNIQFIFDQEAVFKSNVYTHEYMVLAARESLLEELHIREIAKRMKIESNKIAWISLVQALLHIHRKMNMLEM